MKHHDDTLSPSFEFLLKHSGGKSRKWKLYGTACLALFLLTATLGSVVCYFVLFPMTNITDFNHTTGATTTYDKFDVTATYDTLHMITTYENASILGMEDNSQVILPIHPQNEPTGELLSSQPNEEQSDRDNLGMLFYI